MSKNQIVSTCVAAGLAAALAAAPVRAAAVQASPQSPQAPLPSSAARPVGTAGTEASIDSQEYRLGAGDKLRVEVYKDPQLSQSVQVRPDGKITMPFIGDVAAAGLTSLQLRDHLTAALRDYVKNPDVTVIVVEALASAVYVMGEVNNPGTLPMPGPMTVLQALAMAGGFKDFAKTSDIRILRRNGNGVDTIKFNYKQAVKDPGEPVYLKRGDTIIVP